MTTNINNSAAAMLKPPLALPSRGSNNSNIAANLSAQSKGKEGELRDKFTQFVGEAFYGQMLKSMRSTVGKPAYFYGGHAEEVFQGQLDQTMAEHMTKASASKLADPMFERQFPQFSESKSASDLDALTQLSRQ
jgi:Rod binding domain-containing protein